MTMRLFSRKEDQGNVRRLLAAAFLLLVFFDLSGHAFMDMRGASGSQLWCVKFHDTHPGIDCPHKRDHQRPDKSAFDEVSHLAVLLAQEDFRGASAIVFRAPPPIIRTTSLFLSRSLEPPVQPPKQA